VPMFSGLCAVITTAKSPGLQLSFAMKFSCLAAVQMRGPQSGSNRPSLEVDQTYAISVSGCVIGKLSI
jgi:hypothetical protein